MWDMTRLTCASTAALLAVCALTTGGYGGAIRDFAVGTKDFTVFMLIPNMGRTPEERRPKHEHLADNCLDGEWMRDPTIQESGSTAAA